MLQLFATEDALDRHPDLTAGASVVSAKDAAALSETVTPQGLVAVCRMRLSGTEELLARSPRLLVVLVEAGEPGNVGTIIRTADAAGADAVILAGGADPFSGKAVRASAGSVFHLPLAKTTVPDLLPRLRAAGMAALATTGAGDAFIGSLSVFLAEGIPERDAVARASLYAALSTTRVGTQKSFPRRAELEAEWTKRGR